MIRNSIKSRTDLDINKLNPVDFVQSCFIPSLFIVAKGDDFVRPHHGETLYNAYVGDKNLIRVEGDHNSERPYFMMDSVSIFFHNVLQCDKLPSSLLDDTNLIAEEVIGFNDFRLDKLFEQ